MRVLDFRYMVRGLSLATLVASVAWPVAAAGAIDVFTPITPGKAARVETALARAASQLTDAATFVRPSARLLATLVDQAPEQFDMVLPFKGERLVLSLRRVDIFAPGFSVVDESGRSLDLDLGVHYEGEIVGDRESRVAVSVFRSEIAGMAYSPRGGNVQFGRVLDATNGEHVVFADTSLLRQPAALRCSTDHGTAEAALPAGFDGAFDADAVESTSTVRIYVEAAYNMVSRLGSQGTTTYVNSVFNLSRQLYANERIPVAMSQLRLNTAADGYGTNPSSNLSRFQQSRASTFSGQLAQLVGYGTSGGIAAGFSGFCNANRANSMCTSLLDGTYSNLPTWSYSVEVFTHELGHLMGSRHTHACVWNGNNTAIDGCAGYVEGSCLRPNVPASQGTIMSYCRGFSFNNGFGPQPGSVVRARYAAASCF